MRPLTTTLSGIGLAALTAIAPAMAQNPQADYATCDAYARQAVQPYLNQANAQGVGSALVGAGLGAALGAAIGGGRGAGIGAAIGRGRRNHGRGQQFGIRLGGYPEYVQFVFFQLHAVARAGLRRPGLRRAGLRRPGLRPPAYQQPYPTYYGYPR